MLISLNKNEAWWSPVSDSDDEDVTDAEEVQNTDFSKEGVRMLHVFWCIRFSENSSILGHAGYSCLCAAITSRWNVNKLTQAFHLTACLKSVDKQLLAGPWLSGWDKYFSVKFSAK